MFKLGIFTKLYISFVALMIIVVSTMYAVDRLTGTGPTFNQLRHPAEVAMTFYVESALGRNGQPQSEESLIRMSGIQAEFVELREGWRARLSATELEMAERAVKSGKPQLNRMEHAIKIVMVTNDAEGKKYVVAGAVPNEYFLLPPGDSAPLLGRLSLFLLITLGACYGLAKYLIGPLLILQETTHQLAAGNLSARVSPELLKRNDEWAGFAEDFDKMAERIEVLILLHRQLIGDISHELRSPLARLNVALDLARKKSGLETQTALDRISVEAETLDKMIEQVLMITRLESGIATIQMAGVDLDQLVFEIAQNADYEARGKNRQVTVAGSCRCKILADSTLLGRAIENVVRNAVFYTGENTTVEIRLQKSTENGQNFAEISVRDYGPGVPEAELTNIFRPFYRVSAARERSKGGAGLGLSITERALRLHGGRINANNDVNQGLIVSIKLPMEEKSS